MSDVFGTVQRVTSKPTRNGGTVYNIQMDDGQWYGFGFNAPTFGQGAQISFDVNWNGQYGNVVEGSVNVQSPGNAPQGGQGGNYGGGNRGNGGGNRGGGQYGNRAPRSGGGRGAGGSGGNAKDDYWKRKEEKDVVVQRQIQYQSARNAAIEVIKCGLDNDAVPLPSAKKDKLDAILGLVDEITDRFMMGVDGVAARNNPAQQQPQHNMQDDPNGFDDDINF